MGWEDTVRKSVEDVVSKKTIELAKKAADELTKEYKHVLDNFYGEYYPNEYVRTGGLAKSGRRYYKNAHGGLGVVYGGVEFGPDLMPDNYKNPRGGKKRPIDNPHRVFDSFLNGFHGPEFMGIAAGIGDPYWHMIQFRNLLMNNLV